MKAKVKAAGEIVSLKEGVQITFKDGSIGLGFRTDNGEILNDYQLDFKDVTQEKSDVKEKYLPKDEPDYWDKLKHQYAGMVMQGIIDNKDMFNTITNGIWPPDRHAYIATICDEYATALVNRLKDEER